LIESLKIVPIIILVLVLVPYVWSGTFLKRGFSKALSQANSKDDLDLGITSTVLVAGKNEAENIGSLFECFGKQTQGAQAYLFVDDGSSDATQSVLGNMKTSNLKVISIPESRGKKNALRMALEDVEEGRVLMTDADCKPRWKWIENHRGTDREIIVGYAPLKSSGLVGEIVAHETFLTAAMTAAAIGHDRAYMTTGRNWSFPISLYHEVGAFDGIEQGISGDDDLLFQKMLAQPDVKTTFAFNPESWVDSDGPSSLTEWFRQKRRHSSAGRYYSTKFKIALATFQAINILLWLMPFANMTLGLLLGLLFKYYFSHMGARFYFYYKVPFLRFMFREFLYFLYNLIVVPIGLLAPPKKW